MDPLTWTGALSVLNPFTIGIAGVFAVAIVAQIVLSFFAPEPTIVANPDGTVVARGGAYGTTEKAVRWLFLALVALVAVYLIGGVLMSYGSAGIIGGLAKRFLPVWISLVVLFTLSFRYKRRLGLYGKLFDSMIGMIGFAIVMFWVFSALFAPMIATHDVLSQISQMKNKVPGTPTPDEMGWYLLGGDHLGRDVFSRVVLGSRIVVQIAPLATLLSLIHI